MDKHAFKGCISNCAQISTHWRGFTRSKQSTFMEDKQIILSLILIILMLIKQKIQSYKPLSNLPLTWVQKELFAQKVILVISLARPSSIWVRASLWIDMKYQKRTLYHSHNLITASLNTNQLLSPCKKLVLQKTNKQAK